jgi:pilus assembly protein CpaF
VSTFAASPAGSSPRPLRTTNAAALGAQVDRLAALVDGAHRHVLATVNPSVSDVAGVVRAWVRTSSPLLSDNDVRDIERRVGDRMHGWGVLADLLGDPSVSEVLVNGGSTVWVERRGQLTRADVAIDADEVGRILERVLAPLGRRLDRSSPLVDARLPDGSRVHAVIAPLAVDGPCVSIRRFAARTLPLEAFCPNDVAELLRQAVHERRNIVVSGGTSSGKTTLLNALASHVGRHERIITVEDAAELRLDHPHVVRLESRPADADGAGAVAIRDLVRAALRMRPDRIVVGECRGGEALDMVQAMNTGHEGSLTTCHANTPADALRRLETMVLWSDTALPLDAVRDSLSASLDVIVQLGRGTNGQRVVTHVAEVVDGPARVRLLGPGDRWLRPSRCLTDALS